MWEREKVWETVQGFLVKDSFKPLIEPSGFYLRRSITSCDSLSVAPSHSAHNDAVNLRLKKKKCPPPPRFERVGGRGRGRESMRESH